jgi:hypothetical protein
MRVFPARLPRGWSLDRALPEWEDADVERPRFVRGWLGGQQSGTVLSVSPAFAALPPTWRRPPGEAPQLGEDEYVALVNDRLKSRDEFTGLYAWGRYWLILHGGLVQGRLEVMGLEVRAYPSARDAQPSFPPITAEAMRGVLVGEMSLKLREAYVAALEAKSRDELDDTGAIDAGFVEWEREQARRVLPVARAGLRTTATGRPGLTAEYLREVAEFYSREELAGRRPTKGVADHWSVSPSTAAKWVSRARKLGYLPETTKGVAKGADLQKGVGN